MSAINMMRDALFGNPPVPGFKPTQDGVFEAFQQFLIEAAGGMTEQAIADVAISAGQFVHVFDTAGVLHMVLATASDATKRANGFVYADVANGATGTFATSGVNSEVTVATFADMVYLSDSVPGGFTATPNMSAALLQPLGMAIPGSGISFIPSQGVVL